MTASELQREIDAIDSQIGELSEKRKELAQKWASAVSKFGIGDTVKNCDGRFVVSRVSCRWRGSVEYWGHSVLGSGKLHKTERRISQFRDIELVKKAGE